MTALRSCLSSFGRFETSCLTSNHSFLWIFLIFIYYFSTSSYHVLFLMQALVSPFLLDDSAENVGGGCSIYPGNF